MVSIYEKGIKEVLFKDTQSKLYVKIQKKTYIKKIILYLKDTYSKLWIVLSWSNYIMLFKAK
jgi:hypothetical protein